MPHVYRPTYTRPIPANAERCTHKKKPGVRWRGRGNKVILGVVCEDNPARCRVESSVWRLVYNGPDGSERDEPGYTDRAATEALLAERVKLSARVSAGMLPAAAMSERLTLPELLAEFETHLRDSGRSERYAHDRRLMAQRVAESAGAAFPADLTPAAVVRAVAAVRRDLDLSPLTAGYHLSATKQFTRWLAVTRRSEPTDHLSGLRCELDASQPTFTRRSLSPPDFEKFVSTTRASPRTVRGLTGRERAALYLTAATTGLRASELAKLTPGQFSLDGEPPTVTARAAYAKGRRLDELPLDEDLVRALRPVIAATGAGDAVWPNREKSAWAAWWLEAPQMIRQDLEAAGIAAADAAGAVFDFHSLRVQYATDLERAGVGLAAAQRLMRHSTPKLTSNTYTKRSAAELAAEVRKLAGVRKSPPKGRKRA